MGFHGDGGRFTKQDGVYVLSWNSLTQAFGPTLDTRFLFTVMRKSDLIDGTMDNLLKSILLVNECVLKW